MFHLRNALLLPALAIAAPLLAQSDRFDRGAPPATITSQGNAEPSTRIAVEAFRAADALALLGKGRIVITDASPIPDDTNQPPDDTMPIYEAAIIDELARKGYDVAHVADPGQLAEVTVSHAVVVPEEARHKPVSGAMSVGVSNRGIGYGLAIGVDLSKPKKAIIATRIAVRIRDAATRRVLWEGHAEGQSRATDTGRDDPRIAARLAKALFARFPEARVIAAP